MINKLNARAVKDAKKPGRLGDGGGLWLQVSKTGSKSWLFVYRFGTKEVLRKDKSGHSVRKTIPIRPELGLGPYPVVTLADARRKAEEARRYLAETPKRDPRRVWATAKGDTVALTFGDYTDKFLNRILADFRNAKHRQQWENTLRTYCASLWEIPIGDVETPDVLKCLQPIWSTKQETANRLRGRIERIMDAAKAEGLRSGENPARWRGNLQASLPKRKRVHKHHTAVPYKDMPNLMADLRESNAGAAAVLRLLILTGARSIEARGALWAEVDIEARTWTLPPNRMKAERLHTVPLSDAALSVFKDAEEVRRGDLVFPGQAPGKPFSDTAVMKVLRRAYPHLIDGRPVTLHGFRSTFRDWAGDKTTFSREVAELSIAHAAGNALERAYRRGDALEKRRALMDAWGEYCTGSGADVVQLRV